MSEDVDPGDLTKAKKLREDLNCKSFKWFMETLLPDLPSPLMDDGVRLHGALQNQGDTDKCLDAWLEDALLIYGCYKKLPTSQHFLHLLTGQIRARFKNLCLEPVEKDGIKKIYFKKCSDTDMQKFFYNEVRLTSICHLIDRYMSKSMKAWNNNFPANPTNEAERRKPVSGHGRKGSAFANLQRRLQRPNMEVDLEK